MELLLGLPESSCSYLAEANSLAWSEWKDRNLNPGPEGDSDCEP